MHDQFRSCDCQGINGISDEIGKDLSQFARHSHNISGRVESLFHMNIE